MQYASAAHATEIMCYVPRASEDLRSQSRWYTLNYLPLVFSALRVFALSGRNRFLTSAVLVLSLAPVALDFVGTLQPSSG